MSPKNQAKAIADWKIEGPRRETARARRGLPIYIPDEEKDIYNKITTEARARLDQSGGPAPAMSVVEACPQVCQPGGSANGATPPHIDNITSKGQQTYDFWALVHTPVKPADIRRIPAAKAAVDKEFNKLFEKTTWDFSTVQEKSKVKERALKNKTAVHFAGIMELCHKKNSQLEEIHHRYKGRIVLRGDNIKDESSTLAVFSETAASASHVEAARSIDAIARMPGCDGYDIDAIGAYHQIPLGDDCPPTWCSLPRHRWPAGWEGKSKEPVVLLKRNLYGHPRAGFYWEAHVQKVLTGEGFKPIPGWECVYHHQEKQLLVSVYVDDFKIGGNNKNTKPMIKRLGKLSELDEAMPLNGDVKDSGSGFRRRAVVLGEVQIDAILSRINRERELHFRPASSVVTLRLEDRSWRSVWNGCITRVDCRSRRVRAANVSNRAGSRTCVTSY